MAHDFKCVVTVEVDGGGVGSFLEDDNAIVVVMLRSCDLFQYLTCLHSTMALDARSQIVCSHLSGVESPTVAMNCLRFELSRLLHKDGIECGQHEIPPVRLLSACEWYSESQKEILAFKSETMPGVDGHDSDGCLFGDINVPC